MKTGYFLWLASVLLVTGCSFTQKVKTGLQAYEVRQYAVAVELFQKEYETASLQADKAKLAFLTGESYSRMNDAMQAAKWYGIASADGFPAEAKEKEAQSLIRLEKYDEALSIYESLAASQTGNAAYRAAVTSTRQARDWSKDRHPNISIQSVSFNSTAAEYTPQPIGPGRILFTSDRNSRHASEPYLWTGRSFADLYVWNRTSNTVEEFDSRLNSSDNEGTAVLSPDGNTLYMTRCYVENVYDAWCKIMVTHKRDGLWTVPESLPFIQENINYGQPALAAEGTTMFFTCNATTGQGGHDLYYTQLDKQGIWSEPVNLGPRVNTESNEMYPTVYKDTLFFSSDHAGGLGGLDIYKTWLNANGEWVPPINLRAPINSGGDDFGYVVDTYSPLGKDELVQGYFSTSRDGANKGDEIYAFQIRVPDGMMIERPEEQSAPVVESEFPANQKLFLSIKVMAPVFENPDDPNSRRSGLRNLPNGPIIITEGTTDRRLVTDELGQLLLQLEWNKQYVFTARYRDHLAAEFAINTAEVERKPDMPIITVNHMFTLEPIFKNKEIVLENIFYDYDQWAIRKDAEPSLNHLSTILKTNPQIRIQLSSHTDCRGTAEYNLELSQKRAQAAIDYLKSTGIPAKRLEAVGLGESSPTVNCECEQCTEDQHQVNRRTTFTIID